MSGKGPNRTALNTHRMDGERLVIAVPNLSDAPHLFQLVGGVDRLEVTAGLIWDGPDEVSQTIEFIEQAKTATYGEHGFNWALKDRSGEITGEAGRALGMIGTRPVGPPGRGDVGYWLGRPYWGKGLMTEALTLVLDLCFTELDLAKIEAEVFVGNERSARLVERLGMRLEGTIRSAHHKREEWVDAQVFGLLREEWLSGSRTLIPS
jgi:ribosomal-protein-alanine N-acetyltransferase